MNCSAKNIEFFLAVEKLSQSQSVFGYAAKLLMERDSISEEEIVKIKQDMKKQIGENRALMADILGSSFHYFDTCDSSLMR